jgi:hypothetical protein
MMNAQEIKIYLETYAGRTITMSLAERVRKHAKELADEDRQAGNRMEKETEYVDLAYEIETGRA